MNNARDTSCTARTTAAYFTGARPSSATRFHCTACRWTGTITSPFAERDCPCCGRETISKGDRAGLRSVRGRWR